MPYIPQKNREFYNKEIDALVQKLTNYASKDYLVVGELNYVISSIIWRLFDAKPSYSRSNDLVGCLECVKQEFVRRKLNPYEDKKIASEGDL